MQCTYWKNLNITKLIKFIYCLFSSITVCLIHCYNKRFAAFSKHIAYYFIKCMQSNRCIYN